ncbi:ABC transporter permease [Peribacillus psychrosaccharolyticus]|uniref:ABC transporter permease n=1 Tax=Peribacillus psychrosaccharolyticus TaxID=1407 RepID=A0A974NN33_PERPY|nr:ABC transporter permease [Peribacillus psychrosaccharolyticus]MEC2056109.1 ABC transporter permease [Peribacillus psychrosaccharolyticus]MED3745550.1 ABC transporter permease [Peribacillus psychrosaccharolyticus]QQT00697.1 ABC transporter permease [Peribacillus psychrosaccharolyticus]
MRLFKEKLAWAAPLAVILIIALFSVNLFAQGNPKVKNLPVALIVNDEGVHVDAVQSAVKQMSKGTDGEEPMLAFTNEKEENIETLFDDKKYYAALVIPEGYNDSLQNGMKNNTSATLNIYINQGYNMTGANFAKTALNGLVTQLNNQYSTNFIAQMDGQQIDAAKAAVLVNPIVSEEKVFNEITASTANGSAPTLMAVPAWVGALIGGFILFLVTSNIFKKEKLTRKQTLRIMGGQILFGVIIALFSGFTVATLASIAGINMPSYLLVAFFVSFAAFCFFLLVSAITAWIGKPAITLFMVVMLLGMGVLMTPQEMLPGFFVNFIRPWVPIRFASEGLRDIFYFGSGFYTGGSFITIAGIGIVGLVIYLLSIFKPEPKTK